MNKTGISYLKVVEVANSVGFVEYSSYSQHPRDIKWRRAVYKAYKLGLLKRRKGSKPSRMIYEPVKL